MDKVKRGRKRAGSVSMEFTAALAVFILIILFPLINLISLAMTAGTQYLLTVECAGRAGNSVTFADALTAMESTAKNIVSSGFGQFCKLKPVSGYSASGTNLFVNVTKLAGGGTMTYGPNLPYAGTIDKSDRIYEYQVRSTFDASPFMDLSYFPFIGDVPGIGKPVRLSFSANSIVEFSDGLVKGGNGTVLSYGGSGSSSGAPGSPIGPGTGGLGSLPTNVVFNTVVPDGDRGSYLITIYGGTQNGTLIYSMQGGYINQSASSLISTVQQFNSNGTNGSTSGLLANAGTNFTANNITYQGAGTDSNWSSYDMAMDGILMSQIADPGSVEPGNYIYWDSSGNWHTDGDTLFNPYNATPNQAAAMATAWSNFMGWLGSQ